ncbi:class I tRNA ligase family protein [Paucibacter sp. O1-1]|nr:class I tRNA ligase family protein [Paucibacter sp. O1-1]MDA3827948.1 class I tRNA ligase family protein [Paucibacter sp. O1-1]
MFINKETQELHPETPRLIEEVAKRIEVEGIDAWFDLDADLLGDESEKYSKVTDTLDVWFDSGVTHYSVIDQREELSFPADLYLEGSDQHRGWFQSSLKTSIAIRGVPPYKQVLTHGFTVDGDGRKMSKSLGNVLSPQKVMDTLGAGHHSFMGGRNRLHYRNDSVLVKLQNGWRILIVEFVIRLVLCCLTLMVLTQHYIQLLLRI